MTGTAAMMDATRTGTRARRGRAGELLLCRPGVFTGPGEARADNAQVNYGLFKKQIKRAKVTGKHFVSDR